MTVAEVAFAIQSAKGTPAATSTERVYLVAGEIPAAPKVTQPRSSTTTTRIAPAGYVSSIRPGGSFRMIVRPESIGALLYAVLGAKAVAGASDPRTHTFTLATSIPWLTVWRHVGGFLNERLADVRIARLVLSGEAGKPLQATVDLLGGSLAYRTAQETAVVVETSDAMLFHHGAGALRVEGVAVSSIDRFTLTIDAGVRVVETLAGPLPFLDGKAKITAELDQALVDAALYNRLVYGSATPANLAAPTLTPLELAGAPAGLELTFTEQATPERSLRLAVPRVLLLPIGGLEARPGWGPQRQRLDLEAVAPAGGVSPLTATLKNALAAY